MLHVTREQDHVNTLDKGVEGAHIRMLTTQEWVSKRYCNLSIGLILKTQSFLSSFSSHFSRTMEVTIFSAEPGVCGADETTKLNKLSLRNICYMCMHPSISVLSHMHTSGLRTKNGIPRKDFAHFAGTNLCCTRSRVNGFDQGIEQKICTTADISK